MKVTVIIISSLSILFLFAAIHYGFGVHAGKIRASDHMTVALIATGISIITHGFVIAFFPEKKRTENDKK
ncbi:MAG: hypothetical protein D8M57_05130 [Candidatus Scalindua sp. AMX11]|nr:MAG: hypothetical protein DWQ00_07655 [Candidatus Scalindua sp.]NOG86000.1 hypothetical protein [Planctomycetota bacterium]RZV91371.1 MAG: hypothetical protein EX341_05410 [Candidatus Scalindua sp. SCAELEC01]TDE65927.1 MAG: hypothetical protein D8M57_05130 [Candidatus Scalindua sp. AMX11]GJQ59231.1 MAG: hypothetical protein SCALA701_20320 [Candidatus Scalindua sp.]